VHGFLEGFLSEHSADVDTCIMGVLAPFKDVHEGIADIKAGIKARNLTEIEQGVADLHKVMTDLPAAMSKCHAMEQDIKAIVEVLKGFRSLKDLIDHIKDDLAADNQGEIAAELELMVRSFEEKKYQDFGNHAGQLLHRLVIGPEGSVLAWPGSKCTGSDDPKGPYPLCYEGSAGALGLKEDVKVKILTYASGKGTMDIVGSGIEAISCKGKAFTKSGQAISPSISDCLPSVVTIQKVDYCSDSDAVVVTVKDKSIPLPVSATLKKTACPSASIVV
jgi:hypothetical protein